MRQKGTTPEAATVIPVRYDGDPDLSSNSRELRNGQILATPHLMKFKMPVPGAPPQSGDIKR